MRNKEHARPVDNAQAEGQIDLIQFTHWIAQMQTELGQSIRGTFLQGARPVPITANGPISTSAGSCVGFSLRNTDQANTATIQLYDQDQAGIGGTLILTIQLAAGESRADSYFPGGVGFADGLFAIVTTTNAGAVEGSIWLRAND